MDKIKGIRTWSWKENNSFREAKGRDGVKMKSTYEEANTDDTVVRNYGNTVKLLKLELQKFDGNIWNGRSSSNTPTKDYK